MAAEDQSKGKAVMTLADAVRSADCVKVILKYGKEPVELQTIKPTGLIDLSNLFAAASFEDRGLYWHVTRRDIEFWKEGKKMCTISPEGDQMRCFGVGFSSDYFVGRPVVEGFEKWVSNQKLVPMAASITPSSTLPTN